MYICLVGNSGNATNATEWSAMVAQMNGSDVVQVEVHERWGLEVKINGQSQDFEDLPEQTFTGQIFSEI